MDFPSFRDRLDRDVERLMEAAGRAPDATVPSCPDWNNDDLAWHLAEAFTLVAGDVRNAPLREWPVRGELGGVELLAAAHAELRAEFAARDPSQACFAWYGWDQTVGYWIRRMAQESLIHRVDAELAAGLTPAPIPADMAVDGVDEALMVFLRWHSRDGEDLVRRLLTAPVTISTGGRDWTIVAEDGRISVSNDEAAAAVTISGEPEAVLLWLWRRDGFTGHNVTVDGDAETGRRFYELMAAFTD